MEKPAFLVGQLGGDYLLEQLTSSNQPFKVIEEFKKLAGLQQKEVSHCIPLLDLHKIPRSEVYSSLVNSLKEQLVDRISTLDNNKLATLLEQSFSYIGFEEVRAVPMTILRAMKEVPNRYLKQLALNRNLYDQCPIEVKRQIWLTNETLFKEEVIHDLKEYATDLDLASLSNEMYYDNNFPPPPPSKRRKEDRVLQHLLSLIGNSVKLYNQLVSYLRNLYVSTKNPRFCTLRAELLMALHDQGVSEIVDIDGAHKFAWVLDACVRDNSMELRRIREMQSFFDTLVEGSSTIGDVAMIIASPYASNTLLRNIFNSMVEVINRQALPKDDETLWYMTQLYSMGVQAIHRLNKQDFRFSRPEKEVVHVFYPLLASMIVDDLSRSTNETAPREIDPKFKQFCDTNIICRRIIMYYLITRIQHRDYIFVEQLLALLDDPQYNIWEEESFIQSLVTELISAKNQLLRSSVFDNFLMKFKDSSIFLHKQLVRFVMEAHMGIPLKDLISYLERLIPWDSEEQVKEKVLPAYELLFNRLGTRLNEQNAPFLLQWLGKLNTAENYAEYEEEEYGYANQEGNGEDQEYQSGQYPSSGDYPANSTPSPPPLNYQQEYKQEYPQDYQHPGVQYGGEESTNSSHEQEMDTEQQEMEAEHQGQPEEYQ